MAIFSSLFFSLALILAVTVGPQTRPWAWGPSLVFLGLAVFAALPSLFRSKPRINGNLLLLAGVTVGWFAWRASISPVAELRTADLLLLAGTVGSFLVVSVVAGNRMAEGIFLWSLSGLLVASVAVISVQIGDPTFSPIFGSRPVTLPSGFFGHYNECANFLIGASFLLAASALFGEYPKITRVIWALSAIAGLGAVYYTRSRGGILAVGGGAVVFSIIGLLISKRRNSRGFSIAVIAVPFVFLAAAGWVYKGWGDAQLFRAVEGASDMATAGSVMDSSIRLHLFGIALSCIGLHPWGGGGSRSFSWECNQFWNAADHGGGNARLEYVHNELLQTATDYGIIGALLLLALLSWISLSVVFRSCSDWKKIRISMTDPLYLGGIAGLAGMFIQSNFSFVFHLFPGALLLGICLGRAVVAEKREEPPMMIGKGILAASGIAVGIASLWMGVMGTRLVFPLWKSFFGHPSEISAEGKVAALSKAIAIWPQATLYSERSFILQKMAGKIVVAPALDANIQEAISDYREAIALHPYDPNLHTNLAGLLGLIGNEQEAEGEYLLATSLEGGMEAAYKAHFRYCEYLVRRGMTRLESNKPDAAFTAFTAALQQFEKIKEKTPWMPDQLQGLELKISLLLGLGMSQEAVGDFEGALASYDQTSKLYGGSHGHYRAGLLLGKMGETAWMERRPSQALALFQKARQQLEATMDLPIDMRAKRSEYLEFITGKIQYLHDARIELPKESGD